MVFALWGDKIPIDDRLAMAAGAIAIFTYFFASGWNVYGQFFFLYVLMWCAVRLPLQNWEKHGDLSYGIYIYAWPIQQFVAFFDIYKLGWFAYHVIVVVACHIAAYLSWHLLEKRALSLKNWTPRWLAALLVRLRPTGDRIKRIIVNPDYSSTHFAKLRRHDIAALEAEQRSDALVTHEVEDRVDVDDQHPPDGAGPPGDNGPPGGDGGPAPGNGAPDRPGTGPHRPADPEQQRELQTRGIQ
jgi:hypothetical protein